jgi:hypothetical protein|tara:strand:+ start:77 stop:343 length:267 start_codon:yes stop_codon:yes gene_type:complete
MKIEKNTICYTSEAGHKNFWYPTTSKVIVKENCEAERMPWISGGNSIAIKILKSNLMPLDITTNTTYNISPPTNDEYTVVWIMKCLKN